MSVFQNEVDAFLGYIGTPTFTRPNLRRVWQAFMAYCMCKCAESFLVHGATVSPENVTGQFVFKCFPKGNPDNYSWFEVLLDDETFELRLSIDARNPRRQTNMILNLDIALIEPKSINRRIQEPDYFLVDASNDLLFFGECKNLGGFPELIAGFGGQVSELQLNRLLEKGRTEFRFPACLFLTGNASSPNISRKTTYWRKWRCLRVYANFESGDPAVQKFVNDWFT